jgi:hypothetical protein
MICNRVDGADSNIGNFSSSGLLLLRRKGRPACDTVCFDRDGIVVGISKSWAGTRRPPTGDAPNTRTQANPGQPNTSGSDKSAGQPREASGEDLKGAPQRFPADKTSDATSDFAAGQPRAQASTLIDGIPAAHCPMMRADGHPASTVIRRIAAA